MGRLALAVVPAIFGALLAETTVSSAGSFVAQFGGTNTQSGSAVATDASDNIYAVGTFKNTTDLDPGPGALSVTSAGDTDVYVTKIDASGALIWGKSFGGPGVDVPHGQVTVDNGGNVYVAGYFQNTVDFDPGAGTDEHTATAVLSMFILKLDPNGEWLWARTMEGGGYCLPYDIAIDPQTGDVCTAGAYYVSDVDMDPGPGTFVLSNIPNTLNMFVSKLDSDGNFVWAGRLGNGQIRSLALDSNGDIYTAGVATAAGDMDPGPGVFTLSPANQGVFVCKLTSGGGFLWAKLMDGLQHDACNSIALDNDGNAYTTGYFTGTADFDPGAGIFNLVGGGSLNAFVSKLNSNGDFVWAKAFLTNNGYGQAISVDSASNVLSAGFLGSNVDFDPGPGTSSLNSSNGNKYISKLNAAGDYVWAVNFGGGSGNIYGVAVDGGNNVVTTGNFHLSGDFDPGPDALNLTAPDTDAFILKLDPDGNFTAVSDQPPVADAGSDFSVNEGQLGVVLDGTESSDPDGDPLAFSWLQTAGTSVVLTGSASAIPQFDAPVVPLGGETLTFELTVTANGVDAQDSVNVTVVNVNHPPVADAGLDQSIAEDAPVTLHGEDSFDIDSDLFSFAWTQTSGPAVVLADASTANPTFTAPVIAGSGAPGVVATLVFELVVDDGFPADAPAPGYTLADSTDSVTIEVTNVNNTPTADAGPDQTVDENSAVSMTGSASSDPDSDPLTYSWLQTGGPNVVLAGANTASPSFTAPFVSPGGADLEFELTVDDGYSNGTDSDTVVIHVQNANDPPLASAAEPTQSLLWPPNHGLVAIGITGVTDPDNNATIAIDSVTQDEPTQGLGDGDTAIDAVINGDGTVLIRAERSGEADGRVYHIAFTASDLEGSSSGVVTVSVPKSKKKAAVDSGATFLSTE